MRDIPYSRKACLPYGFTLIELIVVIAILGILAAIAIPKLTSFKNDANKGANEATASIVYHAIYSADAAGKDDPEDSATWAEYTDLTTAEIATVTVTGTAAAGTVSVTVGNGADAGTYPKVD